MKRNLVMFAVIFFIVGITATLFYSISSKLRAKDELRQKVIKIPDANLFRLDSTQFVFPQKSKICLIFFDSECEHCQYEFYDIKKNISLFSESHVIFVSTESISVISKTASNFGYRDEANIQFAKINANDAFANFGNFSLPYILIYDENGFIVKTYRGETKAEAILKHLK